MAKRVITLIVPMLMVASVAMAGGASVIPELDPGSASTCVALLAGGLLVLKGRRRKR